jgi:hypothetical protein
MKRIVFAFNMFAAFAALAVPTLTINSVTQRWPFSPKVDIDFTIENAEGECYRLTDFVVYDGDRRISLEDTSSIENLQPVYAGGTHRLVFDPTKTQLTNIVAVQHFKIGFDVEAQPVRYMIVDLMKSAGEDGAVEYIYDGDPRLETFVQTINYTEGDAAKETTIHYDDAYLAVTNKTLGSGSSAASEYAINKMVFRLVKPGDYRVGKGSVSSSYNAVTLTKPYFISVSLLTRGQYGCIRYGDYAQRDSSRTTSYADQSRAQSLYINDLRGPHDDAEYPVDWNLYGHYVCPTSFIGKARTKYGFAFDQPTETQWEVAARAGTMGYYYVDDDLTAANTDLLNKIGYVGNGDFPGFGAKLANGWGLFDLLGRGQGVLDNGKQGSSPNDLQWPSGIDPVGAYSTWYGNTFSKGGGHTSSSTVACGNRADTNASAAQDPTKWHLPYYNCVRLVINID